MRLPLGLCLAGCLLLAASPAARGDGTIYRYTNKQGRAVYVNHPDQIPPDARAAARPVALSGPSPPARGGEDGPYLALARGQALPLAAAGALLLLSLRLGLVPPRPGRRRLWPAPLLGGLGLLAYVALGTAEGTRVAAELSSRPAPASAAPPAPAPEVPPAGVPLQDVYRAAERRQQKAIRDQLEEVKADPLW